MAAEYFPIEAGHVVMFARAIGDFAPSVRDARSVRGGVAPPTFVQAAAQFDPDYSLRPKPGEPWVGSGRTSSGAAQTGKVSGGLHAEQHFEYHQPLRVGATLAATTRQGGTWTKQGRRGGKLVFTEVITEYRDLDGDLVVTARAVGVRTERGGDDA